MSVIEPAKNFFDQFDDTPGNPRQSTSANYFDQFDNADMTAQGQAPAAPISQPPAPVAPPTPALTASTPAPTAPPKPDRVVVANPQDRPGAFRQGLGLLADNLKQSYFPDPPKGPTAADVQAARIAAQETVKKVYPEYMRLNPLARDVILDRFIKSTGIGMTREQIDQVAREADAAGRSRLESMSGSAVAGALGTGASIVQGLEVPIKAAGVDTQVGNEFARDAEAVRQATTNPAFRYSNTAAQGVGSSVPFMVSGIAGRAAGAAGATTTAVTSALGAAAGAGPAYEKAKEVQASPLQTFVYTLVNAGLGATEAVPIERAFNRFDRVTGGIFGQTMKRYVGRPAKDALNGAMEEVAQELVQTYGSNLADKIILGLQKDLTEGVGDAIVGAGPFGFLMSGVAGVHRNVQLQARAERIRQERQIAEQTAAAKAAEQAPVQAPPPQSPPAGQAEIQSGTEFDAPPSTWSQRRRGPADKKPEVTVVPEPAAENTPEPTPASDIEDASPALDQPAAAPVDPAPQEQAQPAPVTPAESTPELPSGAQPVTLVSVPDADVFAIQNKDNRNWRIIDRKSGIVVAEDESLDKAEMTADMRMSDPRIAALVTGQDARSNAEPAPDQAASTVKESLTVEASPPAAGPAPTGVSGLDTATTPTPREYSIRTPAGMVPATGAEPVSIPGYEYLDTFIHVDDGNWRVYEASTGMGFVGGSKTKQEAVDSFLEEANKRTRADIERIIDDARRTPIPTGKRKKSVRNKPKAGAPDAVSVDPAPTAPDNTRPEGVTNGRDAGADARLDGRGTAPLPGEAADAAGTPDGGVSGLRPGDSDGRTGDERGRGRRRGDAGSVGPQVEAADTQREGSPQVGGGEGGRESRELRAGPGLRSADVGADPVDAGGIPGRGRSGVNNASETTVEPPELDDSGKTPRRRAPKGANYVIPQGQDIAPAGKAQKFEANLAAIRLLRQIEEAGRPATPDEQAVLSRYSGWGWAGEFFNASNPRYSQQYQTLRDLLTPEEFRKAQESTINAYYTSPQVIGPMWDMVRRLGFSGGVVMEPAMGTGNFFGLMPRDMAEGSSLFGVELDNLTARIARLLYPQADIRNESFGDSIVANNSVDLAIGNVPFGAISKIGSDYPNLLIHDYFFVRSLDKVRPGGLVVFITSDGTLNKIDTRVRAMIAERADLIGAFRLPNDAFAQNAGTEVTTDIIILRKKDGTPVDGNDFAEVVSVGAAKVRERDGRVVEKEILVNEYFKANPDNALGVHTLAGTMYSAGDYALVSRPGQDTAQMLRDRVASLPEKVVGQTAKAERFIGQDSLADALSKEGSYVIQDGQFKEVRAGQLVDADWLTNKMVGEDADKPITEAERERRKLVARDWVRLRDVLVDLSNYERRTDATEKEIARRRAVLNKVYDAFVQTHKSTLNHPTQEWRNPAAFLRDDPEYELVQGLEDYKETQKTARNGKVKTVREWIKSEIFHKRFVKPVEIPTKAESVEDALAISMGFMGKVDETFMGSLLGKGPADVRESLLSGGRVFEDPKTGALVPRDQYLSGPVVNRLAEARQAARDNPAYERNVKALEEVQPERLNISDISFSISSRWVPGQVISEWLRDTTGAEVEVNYQAAANAYLIKVRQGSPDFDGLAVLNENGRQIMSASDVLKHALTAGDKPKVLAPDPSDPEKRVVDRLATEQVAARIDQISEKFESWARKTERTIKDRSVQGVLEDAYNDRFNIWRDVHVDGAYMMFPGNQINLRKHQRDAVARNVIYREGVNAHGVGSGKTFTLITTAMEMRRLGLARRPMIVVQRPTIGQFAVSFRRAYPNARILVADEKSLSAKKRRKFLARLAMNDYDAVIVTHPQFDRILPGEDSVRAYYNRLIAELENVIQQAKAAEGKDAATTKQLVTQRKKLEDKLKRSVEATKSRGDGIVSFEQLGIDALLIDEAHNYKKIPIVTRKTRIKGIPTEESQRAVALDIKAQAIQAKTGGKNVILATGTPLTNSMAEAYVMLKISSPKILDQFGIGNFDEFANTFGRINEAVEFTWAGVYKSVQRFNKFINGPELIKMIRASFDVKIGNAELGLKVPRLKGGKAQIVVVPQDEQTAKVMGWLQDVSDAYENMSPKEKKKMKHIPITVMGAGIAAALDPRLIDPSLPEPKYSKVHAVADRVFQHWQESADTLGTQMIFADRYAPMKVNRLLDVVGSQGGAVKGTIELDGEELDVQNETQPMDADQEEAKEEADAKARAQAEENEYKNAKFNLYKEIKAKLVAKGIPADQIAIIHEHNTDTRRDALFEAMREGRVRVLIGSTEKMGVGVDVAKRMVASHHMDPPRSMTPAMEEQRIGRLIRQGNINEEVTLFKYGTEKSMDIGISQLMESKQAFITQALKGQINGREFDDAADEVSLGMQEIRAALAGDDRVIKQADLTAKVRALDSQRRSHESEISGRRSRIDSLRQSIAYMKNSLPEIESSASQLAKAFTGDNLSLTVGSKTFEDRKSVVSALESAFVRLEEYAGGNKAQRGASVDTKVTINGVDFSLRVSRTFSDTVEFVRSYEPLGGPKALVSRTAGGEGMVRSLPNLPTRAAKLAEETRNQIEDSANRIEVLRRDINASFPAADALDKARADLVALNKDLQERPIARIAGSSGSYAPPRTEDPAPADSSAKGSSRQYGPDDGGMPGIGEEPGSEFEETQLAYGGQAAYDRARSAGKTKLTYGQWVLVRTPAFKRWFGDWESDPTNASKVVDENGEPLVVYHGSPDARFVKTDGIFKGFREQFGMKSDGADRAFWFASDNSTAASYADVRRSFDYQNSEPGVIPAFIKAMRPLVIDAEGKNWREAQRRGKTSDVIEQARVQGKDSVIVRRVKDHYNNTQKTKPTDTFLVFDSTQIKSATNNAGTFDPANPDIRYAPAGPTPNRIPVAPIKPADPDQPGPRYDQIIEAWGRRFDRLIRNGRSPRGTSGYYEATNTDTVIRSANDLITALHEIAHAIDDQEGISGRLLRSTRGNGAMRLTPEAQEMGDELSALWKQGSTGTSGRTARNNYKMAEAWAVWMTNYAINPEETRKAYPRTTAYFLGALPDSIIQDIQQTSREVRTHAGLDAINRAKANMRTEPTERLSMVGRIMRAFRGSGLPFETSALDYLASWLTDSLAPVMSGIATAKRWTRRENLAPSKDPAVLMRLWAGVDDQFADQMEHGPIDWAKWAAGDIRGFKGVGGIAWLFGAMDRTSQQTIRRDLEDTAAYMISQRTIERGDVLDKRAFNNIAAQIQSSISDLQKAAMSSTSKDAADAAIQQADYYREVLMEALRIQKPGDRLAFLAGTLDVEDSFSQAAMTAMKRNQPLKDRISGIGGGLASDQDEADAALKAVESWTPERRARIEESARRYRVFADAMVLQPLLHMGRISRNQYLAIKEDNKFYAKMSRSMDEISLPIPSGNNRLGSVAQPIKSFRGGTATIENPYTSVLQAAYVAQKEAQRNAALRSFVDLLIAERGFGDGPPIPLAQIGRRVQSGDAKAIKVYRDGAEEYWQFEPGIHDSLKNWGEIGDGNFLLRAVQLVMARIPRAFITYAPPFLTRNVIRDAFQRSVVSREGSKPWDAARRFDDQTRRMFNLAGAGQAGYYAGGPGEYYAKMTAHIEELSKDKGNLILGLGKKAVNLYLEIAHESERRGRLAEFKAAYANALAKGYSQVDAALYAASKSRELTDFAVAGTVIGQISKYVIFTNAAVQGLRATINSARSNPRGFATRFAAYVLAPTLAVYAWNAAGGDDDEEEYQNLPDWQRDFFWNFKVAPNQWVRIPKPFELGALSSGAERLIDAMRGKPGAFQGYAQSLAGAVIPVNEGTFAGPAKPIVEALANYDFFRHRPIVSQYEVGLDVSKREGTQYASPIGRFVQAASIDTVDARNVDHFVRGQFGIVGDLVTKAAQVAEGRRSIKDMAVGMVGLGASSPATSARSVQYVLDGAMQTGHSNAAPIRTLRTLLRQASEAKSDAERDAAARRAREYATRLIPWVDRLQ